MYNYLKQGDRVRNPRTKTEGVFESVKNGKIVVRVGKKLHYWKVVELIHEELETTTIIPSLTLPKIAKHIPEKKEMSNEEFFRYVYLPFLAFEVAWDYAQTVLNQASQIRIPETKKVSRRLRELMNDWHSIQKKCVGVRFVEQDRERLELFHVAFEKELNGMYKKIMERVAYKHFSQTLDMKMFIASVYMAIMVFEGCRQYSIISDKVRAKYESDAGHIWPYHLREATKLIPQFLGKNRQIFNQDEANEFAEYFVSLLQDLSFVDDAPLQKQKEEYLAS